MSVEVVPVDTGSEAPPASLKDALLDMHAAGKKADKKVNALADVVKLFVGTLYGSFEPEEYLRASGMFRSCPREFVFRRILPRPGEVVSTGNVSSVMRMETGTFLHWYFQNLVLGPAKVLVGSWQRWVIEPESGKLCRKVVYGYRPDGRLPDINDPQSMMSCWTFVEQRLVNEEYKISGHIDGVVDTVALEAYRKKVDFEPIDFTPCDWEEKLPKGRLALLEIKSTDDNVLRMIRDKGVEYLSEEYRCQATIYQRMTGFESTLFLYVDRKYFQFVGFEYVGEDQFWDLSRVRGYQIICAMETRTLPPRIEECPFAAAKRAKECVFCDVCFSEDPDLVWSVMDEMKKDITALKASGADMPEVG